METELNEGNPDISEIKPAGFWIRAGAYTLDILPLSLLVLFFFYFFMGYDKVYADYVDYATCFL